jgi:hypothetical protein
MCMVAQRKITRNSSKRNVVRERYGDDVSCVKPFGMFWDNLRCFTVFCNRGIKWQGDGWEDSRTGMWHCLGRWVVPDVSKGCSGFGVRYPFWLPFSWRRHFELTKHGPLTQQHSVKSQKTRILGNADMRPSNFAKTVFVRELVAVSWHCIWSKLKGRWYIVLIKQVLRWWGTKERGRWRLYLAHGSEGSQCVRYIEQSCYSDATFLVCRDSLTQSLLMCVRPCIRMTMDSYFLSGFEIVCNCALKDSVSVNRCVVCWCIYRATSFSLKAGTRFRYISYEVLCVADLWLGEPPPQQPKCHGFPFIVAADGASVLFMIFTLSSSKLTVAA